MEEGDEMSGGKFGILGAALLAVSLIAAPGASAATEFGDPCAANAAASGQSITIFQISRPGDPLPSAAPSSGVITRWTVLSAYPTPVSQDLKVIRVNAAGGAQIIGGEIRPIAPGVNTFATRIPVQARDYLGLFGNKGEGALNCEQSENNVLLGAFEGDGPTGSTLPFGTIVQPASVPLTAVIEPDVDGDGFGDETQDKCPQSATTQAACPVIALNVSTTKTKKLVNVIVTSTSAASVTVNGKVSLGKGKKAKLKGGNKSAGPGVFTHFHLDFPSSLIDRLKELTSKQSLTLKITASAPNVAGPATQKVLKVKLKGQG